MKNARELFVEISVAGGGGRKPYLLTPQESSAKLVHNGDVTDEYEQVAMYLPQANRGAALLHKHRTPEIDALIAAWSLKYGDPKLHRNLCPHSTAGCRATCLGYAGRLAKPNTERAMLARYLMLCMYPAAFWYLVYDEIVTNRSRLARRGKKLVVRVNGTSDLDVINEPSQYGVPLLDIFPDVLFQDYTKRPIQASGWVAPNYYMVRSITERDGQDVFDNHFGNVVVPVNLPKDAPLPDMFMGRPVVDGDKHDLRLFDADISGADRHAVLVRVKKRNDGVRGVNDHGFIREVV